jgi:hypothetical protein
MNIVKYNEQLLDHAMKVHGFCMDHCLDPDRDMMYSKYHAHTLVREVVTREYQHACREFYEWQKSLATVVYPAKEKLLRARSKQA